jgi:CBS domain-containing protein
VLEGGRLVGIVTDRDLVLRGLAGDPKASVGSICSRDVRTLRPQDSDETARKEMERAGVRRLPVQDGDRLVGMVSVGDLAVRANAKLAGDVMEKTGPEEQPRGR